MSGESLFSVVTGGWGLAMIVVFIQAIRLSYRIEARSPELVNRSGIPRKAMILHTVANWNVARDAETQAMRRRMNLLLLVNLAGFVALWAGLWLTGRT